LLIPALQTCHVFCEFWPGELHTAQTAGRPLERNRVPADSGSVADQPKGQVGVDMKRLTTATCDNPKRVQTRLAVLAILALILLTGIFG